MTKTIPARYRMVKSMKYVEDTGVIPTYGIGCCVDSSDDLHCFDDYETVSDISTIAGFVENLVKTLNKYDVNPIHLKDLIYDSLL
jgi:hypothetical protein